MLSHPGLPVKPLKFVKKKQQLQTDCDTADPQNFCSNSEATDDEMVSVEIGSPSPAERKEQKESSSKSRDTTAKKSMSITS